MSQSSSWQNPLSLPLLFNTDLYTLAWECFALLFSYPTLVPPGSCVWNEFSPLFFFFFLIPNFKVPPPGGLQTALPPFQPLTIFLCDPKHVAQTPTALSTSDCNIWHLFVPLYPVFWSWTTQSMLVLVHSRVSANVCTTEFGKSRQTNFPRIYFFHFK